MIGKLSALQRILDQPEGPLKLTRDLPDFAGRVLRLLGETLECDWGTYWHADPGSLVLRPLAKWNSDRTHAEELDQDLKFRTLSMSQGTAGHVWRSRKPVWTTDLIADMCLPRSLEAQKAGLQGGIWFAVKTEKAVYGVFEILGRRIPPANKELLVGLERFGIRLGKTLEANGLDRFGL